MANIDNTVLAAALLELSGNTTQAGLWFEMMFGKPELDTKEDRFFRGLTPNRTRKETLPRSWWPLRGQDARKVFEDQVKAYFLSCMNKAPFDIQLQKILLVCAAMGVAPSAQHELAKQKDPQALIEYFFRCARQEMKAKSLPQVYLAKHPELMSASQAPSPPAEPLSEQDLLEEGCVLTQVHPSFLARQDYSSSPFFSQFAAVRWAGERWQIPYKELFGSAKAAQGEYIEGKNLTYAYEDWQADLRPRVSTLDFDRELEAEQTALGKKYGYHQHPPKLCLAHYMEEKQEDVNGVLSSVLTMTFGQSGYLEHHVYQKDLARNTAEQQALRALFRNAKGNIPALRYCPWAACGGGVWVITQDGFLALSLRTNVAEEPGKLGYSSSGSYGRYTEQAGRQQDNTPGLAMCKELREELGLEDVSPQDLTLISLGIDLNRCLIQFSYLLETSLTAEDLFFCRQDIATTADEQIVCFVPLDTPDLCWSLLAQCEFEPGAAYSLVRLLQKRFGLP